MVELLQSSVKRLIGYKQTRRALHLDQIAEVYLAENVDEVIKKDLMQICQMKNVPLISLNLTREQLGEMCKIDVGASVIGILKD